MKISNFEYVIVKRKRKDGGFIEIFIPTSSSITLNDLTKLYNISKISFGKIDFEEVIKLRIGGDDEEDDDDQQKF